MSGRGLAIALLTVYAAALTLAVAAPYRDSTAVLAAAAQAPASSSSTSATPPAVNLIWREFGRGRLGGCFNAIAWRESRYRPHAANWHDVHADGSRGSFGLLQIGALWRRPGEPVHAFARRMFRPAANLELGHRLYARLGLQPWGGSCS